MQTEEISMKFYDSREQGKKKQIMNSLLKSSCELTSRSTTKGSMSDASCQNYDEKQEFSNREWLAKDRLECLGCWEVHQVLSKNKTVKNEQIISVMIYDRELRVYLQFEKLQRLRWNIGSNNQMDTNNTLLETLLHDSTWNPQGTRTGTVDQGTYSTWIQDPAF